ncbi:hypothetical protein ATI61_108132 [Archangium gephyra]|uniref:Lipoprotein n=1 Tax=Archangium gephyra TaxID=48 RepID=A0AAC8Q7J2_9BACT|nr:hypothetical protein [Archangium gephyra]AKJ02478.1 Hypothetical protein AA314_04104 [Archangium gephyra]REG28599.1 hypothetical protein ATI61_108132 [Archangium gephyra]
MPRARLPLLLLLALSASACRTAQPQQMAPSSSHEGIALPSTPNGVLQAGEADKLLPISQENALKQVVKLLDAGAQPRSDISYTLATGRTEQLRMSFNMTRSLRHAEHTAPQLKLPSLEVLLDLTPLEQTGAEWKIKARLAHLDAKGDNTNGSLEDEKIENEVDPDLAQMKGLSVSFVMSPKGYISQVEYALPEDPDPEDEATLHDLAETLWAEVTTPLPDEPIGIGATWQVLTRTPGSGMDLLQSATYRLESRNGDKVKVSMELEELVANPEVTTEAMPEGYSATVKSFKSSETGTWNLDMRAITPEQGEALQKTAVTFGEQGEGADAADELQVDTEVRIGLARP